MTDECTKPPYNREIEIPAEYAWESLRSRRDAELETHYVTGPWWKGLAGAGERFTSKATSSLDFAGKFRLPFFINNLFLMG
jgi:hypothetical protein